MNCETLEEVLFYYAVSTLQYAKDNFPQYVYLKVQDFKIFDIWGTNNRKQSVLIIYYESSKSDTENAKTSFL